MRGFTALTATLALCTAAGPAAAAPAAGDPAPALDVASWLRGRPVTALQRGRIHVVAFWSGTRAGRRGVAALGLAQERFRGRGVRVAAVSDAEPEQLEALLASEGPWGPPWSAEIRFGLGADPDRSTHDAYGVAGDRARAFVIGADGTVLWAGPPRDVEGVVAAAVGGRRIASGDDQQMRALRRDFAAALREERVEECLVLIDRLIARDPGRAPRHRLQLFRLLAESPGRAEDAGRVGRALLEDRWHDPFTLNEIAWYLADEDDLATRDLALAMRAAKRADALAGGGNAAILDTVARVYWERGERGTAILWQYRAARRAAGTRWERIINATLRYYESIAPAL